MTVSQRRARERQHRRDRILDAAERLIDARGLAQVTVDEVAGEAELGKGTIYLYFKSKEDLVLGVALRNQAKLLMRFGEASAEASSGADLLERLLHAYFRFMTQEHGCRRAMLHSIVAGETPFGRESEGYDQFIEHIRRTFNTLKAAVERGRHDGTLRAELDAHDTAAQLWSTLIGGLVLHAKAETMLSDDAPGLVELDRVGTNTLEFAMRSVRREQEAPYTGRRPTEVAAR